MVKIELFAAAGSVQINSIDIHIRIQLFNNKAIYTHKCRRQGAGDYSSIKLGRNPFYSGKCSERTIGNSGRKLIKISQSS